VNGSEQADFLAPLKHAEQDAADLAQVLRRSECDFDVHTLFGEQATISTIKNTLFDLRIPLTDKDLLLLYFSGHAEPLTMRNGNSDICFVTYDYRSDKARHRPTDYCSLNWLYQELADEEFAGDILVILDCCYAGNAVSAGPDRLQIDIRSLIKRYDENQSITSEQHKTRLRVILTAAGYNEKAYEHRSLTHLILPALRGEVRNARDEAGDVVLQNLHSHIQCELPTSYLVNDITRRCVLARYAHLSDEAIQQRNQEVREQEQAERRHQRLQAMLPDHTGFLRDRLESFVGRETELADIRQRIAEKLDTGGYVTITGQAGQGKSSIIAKLVEEYGIDTVAYHFIPFNPGPDHQVSLLRNLMARLILKHNLSDIYVASESRPALRDFFPRVLQEATAAGAQEVIFLDGLDQLEPEQSGERDLSFLPADVPPGVVFVLGTRPNDTLKPLELLKPHHEYQLPNLSRADFDLILAHRQVTLDRNLTDRFYTAMQENALYLDLVAKELAEAPDRDPEAVIQRIADNPENIFSLTMDRLRRNRQQWREVIKPVLGLLLATQEPLSLRALRALVGVDDHDMREGLRCLGGLLSRDSQGHFYLFHLKLFDFLRQDETRHDKEYIFAADEEEDQHARLAAWCAQGGLAAIWQETRGVEQERRQYARRHYLTHLYHAQDYQQLFAVLDAGSYGRAKLHWDPSTRSYAEDLELGRQAAARDGLTFDEGLYLLPYLWRYSLLRGALASRADKLPDEYFTTLLLLGEVQHALDLTELRTYATRRAQTLCKIGAHLAVQPGRAVDGQQVLARATQVAQGIADEYKRAKVLTAIATALAQVRQADTAQALLWEAQQVAQGIADEYERAEALIAIAQALAQVGQVDTAQTLLWEAKQVAQSIADAWQQNRALAAIAQALAQVGRVEEAQQVAQGIVGDGARAEALIAIAQALAQVGQVDTAQALLWEAQQVAQGIVGDGARSEALTAIAQVLALARRFEEAQALLWEVQQVAQSIADAWQQNRALAAIAQALAQVGRVEEAQQVAQGIDIADAWQRAEALTAIAQALAQVGRVEEAQQVAQDIVRDVEWAKALTAIAQALALAGQFEDAQALLWEAQQVAQGIGIADAWQRAEALAAIATALVQAGWVEEAQQVAQGIAGDGARAEALAAIAQALAQVGQVEEAQQVAQGIADEYERARALAGIAQVLAQAGQFEEAQQVAQGIAGDGARAEALAAIATALSQAGWADSAQALLWEAQQVAQGIVGDGARAEALTAIATSRAQVGDTPQARALLRETQQVAQGIADAWQQDWALAAIAQALAQMGQVEEAQQVAQGIADEWQWAWALAAIAQALAQMGQVEEAQQVAQGIGIADAWQQDWALATIATALAQVGQFEEAQQVAQGIADAWQRAPVLVAIAQALAQVGGTPQARALLREAQQVAQGIADEWQRAPALAAISQALAQSGDTPQALALIQDAWHMAITYETLVELLPMAASLIPHAPFLGTALAAGFPWLDDFMKQP
jgi:tetratricopeptide (TPR) repeat protein